MYSVRGSASARIELAYGGRQLWSVFASLYICGGALIQLQVRASEPTSTKWLPHCANLKTSGCDHSKTDHSCYGEVLSRIRNIITVILLAAYLGYSAPNLIVSWHFDSLPCPGLWAQKSPISRDRHSVLTQDKHITCTACAYHPSTFNLSSMCSVIEVLGGRYQKPTSHNDWFPGLHYIFGNKLADFIFHAMVRRTERLRSTVPMTSSTFLFDLWFMSKSM